MSIAVIYGSTLGDTKRVADMIGSELGVEVHSLADGFPNLDGYNTILFGSSTWGWGELQDDWNAAIDTVKGLDLNGKKVGVFGTGDQYAYPETYCDALGIIGEACIEAGASLIGKTSKEGYEFSESRALVDGEFMGLAIDVNNQDGLTDERVEAWVAKVKSEI